MTAETIEIFRKADLFRCLDDGVIETLVRNSVEKRITRDEILFLAGVNAAGLYLIAEGSLRAFR